MDAVQASGVDELRADTGSLAGKEKEQIPHPSEITETNSNDQVMEHSGKQSNEPDENDEEEEEEKKKKRDEENTLYLPLYRAALKGDWESARRILENDPNALTAKITWKSETVLHVAVSRTVHAIQFVEELLDFMPAESLTLTDSGGGTALSLAARVGNTKAAKLLVKKNPDLTQLQNKFKQTPLNIAAQYGHKETVCYLLSVTRDEEPSPYAGESGFWLLQFLIIANFYGIALDLLKCYPKLAIYRDKNAFITLAQKPQAFASGSQLGYWQRIIYHCIPVAMDNVPLKPMEGGDVENPTESSQKSAHHRFLQQISTAFGTLCGKVHLMLWITIKQLVPIINHIYDTKLMHKQTLELVKCMCAEVATLSGANARNLLTMPFLIAARLGILEFVREIIKAYPDSIWSQDEDGRDVFQLATLHRQEKIFSLLYQLDLNKHFVASFYDKFGNNLLHSAGTLAPSTRVSGAALQMQRELQWFKEVEKIVQPSFKEMTNSNEKIPRMVFTEEHEKLVKQGEEWMKATATSCTVVAALIATMVFTAAFTVPGGNNSDLGIPIFLHEISFLVFVISDAISLFSSSTSLLMFLGILTSRYSQEDFFMSLPRKLIIGLITLFISISSMVIAFSATLYIALVHRFNWVVIPIGLLACLPVSLFALLQFPLLVEIVLSTYGPSIFRQRSKDVIFF